MWERHFSEFSWWV